MAKPEEPVADLGIRQAQREHGSRSSRSTSEREAEFLDQDQDHAYVVEVMAVDWAHPGPYDG